MIRANILDHILIIIIIIIIIIIVILIKIVIARQKTTPVKCFKYWYLREFSLLK